MKSFLVCAALFVTGCGGNVQALSVAPDNTFTPSLEQAAPLTYEGNTIRVSGLVGDFKIVMKNAGEQEIKNVVVVVTTNSTNLVSSIIFSRIYHEIFWGGSVFSYTENPTLPNGELLQPSIQGAHAELQGDDLLAGESLKFDSIVLGESGLMLTFQAYAGLPDGSHYALPMDSVVVQWEY